MFDAAGFRWLKCQSAVPGEPVVQAPSAQGASPHQLCTALSSALLPYTSPRIQAPTSPVRAVTTPDYVVEVYLLTRRPPRCPSPVPPKELRLGRL